MKSEKKLYAQVINASWRVADAALEVQDEQDAVQKCLAQRAICFTTYEVEHVTLNTGKSFKGEPENHSARRFIGLDRLYTRDEVVASFQNPPTSGNRQDDNMLRGIFRDIANHFKKDPADSAYITGLEREGEYIRLKDGEKVFDRQGNQLWPSAAFPGAQLQPPARAAVQSTAPASSIGAPVKLAGLPAPDKSINALNEEELADDFLSTPDGLNGYCFDGTFHLLPKALAEEMFSRAAMLSQDPETIDTMQQCDCGAFAMLWNLDSIKPGYALFIEGTSGGSSGILATQPDDEILANLTRDQDYFFADDAHMAWPTKDDPDQELDWSEGNAELLRVMKELATSGDKPAVTAAPKPPRL